jgi:hypothetical protein
MKKIISLSGTILLLATIGGISSAATHVSAKPISAAPRSEPEEPPAKAQATTKNPRPVKVRYDAPKDEKLAVFAEMIKSGHLLEDLADEINAEIRLPKDLTLVARQCGEVNAFYQPSRQSIEVCYELVKLYTAVQINDLKDDSGKFDREAVKAAGLSTTRFVLHHELGHALVDLLNLPVTGKEEDAVDQLATVVLLSSDDDADTASVLDGAYTHLLMADRKAAAHAKLTDAQRRFLAENPPAADEHSLDEQRFYDITCLVYGSDPKTFAELVTEGALPRERAARCAGEWKRISSSWSRLLAPYLPGATQNIATYPPAQPLPAKRPPSKADSDSQGTDNEPVEWVDDPRNNVVEGIGLGRTMNRDDNDGGLLPGGVKLAPCVKPLAMKSAWEGLKAKKGLFYGIYCQPANPQYKELHADMLKAHELENIAFELNSFLKIPKPIVLSYRECKQANAFYSPGTSSILMCYELVDSFYDTFKKDGLKGDELDEAVGNAVAFAFYHELGHAVVDVLNLPITGREEDAVDQLATFIVADGADEEETTALDGAIAFLLMEKNAKGKPQTAFWDQHSLGEQRFYNIICSLYGDSPQKYESVVSEGVLPKARAARCGYEWKRIENSWTRLLAPYIKQN